MAVVTASQSVLDSPLEQQKSMADGVNERPWVVKLHQDSGQVYFRNLLSSESTWYNPYHHETGILHQASETNQNTSEGDDDDDSLTVKELLSGYNVAPDRRYQIIIIYLFIF